MSTGGGGGTRQVLGIWALALILVAAWGAGREARAQLRCDADGDGAITDVDGVNVLRGAASLPSACTVAVCDADGDGEITDVDGVNTLRAAASLPSACVAAAPLTLSPVNTTITVGESRFYTATLHLEGGGVENVTQRVDYASSDPLVAEAPNAPGMKSEVRGLSPGVVKISGVDPVSGAASSPGGDATLTVLGPLESIELSPGNTSMTVGESRFYTAIGHFGGGGTQNVTQRVDYVSSDPSVAQAPNVAGMKSQVLALAPGEVTITAVDPDTDVTSTPATLTVLGELERITLAPAVTTRQVGQSLFYTATGHFAGGGTQNLTQQVDYFSSNPAVAQAPNTAGMKSQVHAVGVGETTISAVDPETDVSSSPDGDATLTVEAAP